VRIAIIHNQPEAKGDWLSRSGAGAAPSQPGLHDAAEYGILGEVDLIEASLAHAGHETTIFAPAGTAALCAFLTDHRPDLVFNCCESFAGKAALEMNVAALFELFGVAYTGSSALTLGLLLNKPLTKAVLTGRGIHTPAFAVFNPGEDGISCRGLSYPLIVKPAAEDASIGIDDGAVVRDIGALQERVRFIWREFHQAALVEEFISGREFNVSLLADRGGGFNPLAIGEMAFDLLPPGRPQILGYEAKWDTDAAFTQAMASRCPADIDENTADQIRQTALTVARTVGLDGYGRIDFRMRDSDSTLFVLEANPNPDLSDECSFLRAARASGRTNHQTICEIAARAVERHRRDQSMAV